MQACSCQRLSETGAVLEMFPGGINLIPGIHDHPKNQAGAACCLVAKDAASVSPQVIPAFLLPPEPCFRSHRKPGGFAHPLLPQKPRANPGSTVHNHTHEPASHWLQAERGHFMLRARGKGCEICT